MVVISSYNIRIYKILSIMRKINHPSAFFLTYILLIQNVSNHTAQNYRM